MKSKGGWWPLAFGKRVLKNTFGRRVLEHLICRSLYYWGKWIVLTAHNWQKWKRVFLTCPWYKTYRDEAVGLKIANVL